jgi:oxysterol 7-alpha-hydroxylase
MNTNSGPLTTWFLTNILQSSTLLSRFQAECRKHILHSDKQNIEFDLPKLRAIPLVQGIWKESLRLGSVNAVARVLAKDIELKGYLLRQGSVILIPVQLLHYNTDVFPDPERFDPQRWVFDESNNDAAVKQKQMMAHLRPFGGGGGICSGRFVAEEEVILAAATLVIKYDFVIQNKVELHPMALGIMSPKKGVWVKMQSKK